MTGALALVVCCIFSLFLRPCWSLLLPSPELPTYLLVSYVRSSVTSILLYSHGTAQCVAFLCQDTLLMLHDGLGLHGCFFVHIIVLQLKKALTLSIDYIRPVYSFILLVPPACELDGVIL